MNGKPPRFRDSWKAKALLALGSLVLGWICVEVLARLAGLADDPWRVPPETTIRPYGANAYVQRSWPFLHFQIPGSVYWQEAEDYKVRYEVNSRGFRGPEISIPPPAGRKRLLVVGDSMVEGHGVEFDQAFPALLNRDFKEEGWEIVNVGMQGGSPLYYAANLPRYLALKPDAILLVLYDNDPRDDYERERAYDSLPVLPDCQRLVSGEARQTVYFSRVWTFLSRRLNAARSKQERSPIREIHARHLNELAFLKPGVNLKSKNLILVEEEWPDGAVLMRDYLDYFAQELHARQVRLLVARLSISSRLPQAAPEEKRAADLFDSFAREWTASQNLPCFSLQDALQAELNVPKGRPAVVLPKDNHLSVLGHQVVAEALVQWLRPLLGVSASQIMEQQHQQSAPDRQGDVVVHAGGEEFEE